MKKITKAVIPAAGLGTRVLPASKSVPKEMLNIVDKPAIQYIVEEAAAQDHRYSILQTAARVLSRTISTTHLSLKKTLRATRQSVTSTRACLRARTSPILF